MRAFFCSFLRSPYVGGVWIWRFNARLSAFPADRGRVRLVDAHRHDRHVCGNLSMAWSEKQVYAECGSAGNRGKINQSIDRQRSIAVRKRTYCFFKEFLAAIPVLAASAAFFNGLSKKTRAHGGYRLYDCMRFIHNDFSLLLLLGHYHAFYLVGENTAYRPGFDFSVVHALHAYAVFTRSARSGRVSNNFLPRDKSLVLYSYTKCIFLPIVIIVNVNAFSGLG